MCIKERNPSDSTCKKLLRDKGCFADLCNYAFFQGRQVIQPEELVSREKADKYLPVDMYIGGVEHAVLHLLYSRFYTKFLHDIGVVDFDEPFKKLFNQGMITGKNGIKMSKSKGNVIYADDLVDLFGVDAVRYFVLHEMPFANDGVLSYELICERINSDLANVLGNLVNRIEHSQSGAVMAFQILTSLGFGAEDVATIVTAIGNHDEGTGVPVNAVAAALILADKADVRRSRVRNQDTTTFDIHDRVNYSVKKSTLKINEDRTLVKLKLTVDTHFGSVMDYFEIFMQRMILCRKAAEKLGLQFKLIINEQQLI